jgi:hypothetical protein
MTADLKGTRGYPLAKFAGESSPQDFSRLVFLMRNLVPIIIPPGRPDLILNGFPHSKRLFEESEYAAR